MEDSSLYPLTPGYQNTDTSKAAAESVESKAAALRLKCLALVRAAPKHDRGLLREGVSPDPKRTPAVNSAGQPVGLTARELAAHIGQDDDNVHPRVSELRSAGLVRDSGVRRLNTHSGRAAIAWTPGRDPAVSAPVDNAPPKAPKQREAYVRGMAAAYYTLKSSGSAGLLARLAELEPGNTEWQV